MAYGSQPMSNLKQQRNEIIQSKKLIETGQFTNQEDLNQEFEKWLSANKAGRIQQRLCFLK